MQRTLGVPLLFGTAGAMFATLTAPALAAAALLAMTSYGGHDDNWDERRLRESDTEEIRRTFAGGTKPLQVLVDNWSGSIEVVAHDADRVELVAQRTNRAWSQEKLAAAKSDVKLLIEEEPGSLRLIVDGPQRNRKNGNCDVGSDRLGYQVDIDFTLKVPRHAEVNLRTVNDGEIKVTGVRGGFDVENINGGIEMLDVGGSGRAYALNGAVHVTFASNPDDESYFGSLNGDVEVEFRRDLAAELRMKTFNGEVYSDFEVSAAAAEAMVSENHGGKRVYRAGNTFGVRVGRGGPRLEFDAFNGDIRIVNRD